ncbi:MAG TPA: flagellar hook-length control protein FliK, partial [Bacilli bacterium]|nr:flagellar hook-length control protein FliK [Bacilli bacterium]
MDAIATQTTATSTTASTSASATGTGKAEGKSGQFEALMKKLGLSTTSSKDEKGTDDNGLLSLLAALAGGLNPLTLNQLTQGGDATTTEGEGLMLQVQVGGKQLSLNLNNLSLTNEQLASLLQNFGASPSLLSVLMEQPQGQPGLTLQSHPELLTNLTESFGQALQQLTQVANGVPNEQVNLLMQTVMAQLQEPNTEAPVQKSGGKQTLLNKMQASLSSHLIKSSTNLQPEEAKADGTALTTPVIAPHHAATVPLRPQTAQTASVLMRADQMRTELPGVLIKRAALIEAPGRQEFRIVMEPQGLGELQVRVQKAQNGQISVHIAADSLAAKAMIDAGLASLKLHLQAQGIQYDRIEVS